MSQASSARQTQPALVKGRLARTSSPMMAGGAKHRKKRSARLGVGTGRWRTTSYQPHTPFPRDAMAEETANRIHAGRKRLQPAACVREVRHGGDRGGGAEPEVTHEQGEPVGSPAERGPRGVPAAQEGEHELRGEAGPSALEQTTAGDHGPGGAHGATPVCAAPVSRFPCAACWGLLRPPLLWRPPLRLPWQKGRLVRTGVRAGRHAAARRVGSFAHRSCIARRPLAIRLSVPGAELSTALPQSGRYTRLVTQGHSLSTLRDDQRRCAYRAHPGGRGACAGAREAGPGGGGWASPEPALSPSSGRRSRADLPPRTGSAARRAGAWPAARRRMWSRRRAG